MIRRAAPPAEQLIAEPPGDAAVAIAAAAPDYPPLGRAVAAFGFLLVAEFFYSWAWNTVDVLRPQIRDSLGLTLTQAGSTYTAQSIGALVGAVALGQIADRWGRRRTLFVVVVGYAVFGGLGALAPPGMAFSASGAAVGRGMPVPPAPGPAFKPPTPVAPKPGWLKPGGGVGMP